MKNRVVFLIAVFLSSASFSAIAQESVELEHRGVEGRWFPRPMVDEIQRDILELDALKIKVPKLQLKLDLRMKRIEDLRLATTVTTKALEVSKGAVDIAEKAAVVANDRAIAAEAETKDVREQMGKWYRSPVFCGAVGAVAIVVLEVILWAAIK